MNEHSIIYMTKLYDEAMDLNTKLQEELENLKNTNEEHRVLNGKLREENKRLNNIINEAREYIEERYQVKGTMVYDSPIYHKDILEIIEKENNNG